ncbi:MAG: hypothetical protein D6806_01735, partial [Deltaproteobacteria bacterium]
MSDRERASKIAQTLHPMEVALLQAVGDADGFWEDELAGKTGLDQAQVRTVIEWQKAKGCLEVADTRTSQWVELTDAGKNYLEGTPEILLLEKLRKEGPELEIRQLTSHPGLDQREAGTALGNLRKLGLVRQAGEGRVALVEGADTSPVEAAHELIKKVHEAGRIDLGSLGEGERKIVEASSRKRGKSRGIFRIGESTTRMLRWTELGRQVARAAEELGRRPDEINQLTPEMLADGSWRDRPFRRYNLTIPPPRRTAGRLHPYRQFLDSVRRKMLALGFEEMSGELVEPEFWLMDALFMPQF